MELPQIFTGALAKLIMADKHTALSSERDIGLHNYRPFPVNGDIELSLVLLRKMGPRDSKGNRRFVLDVCGLNSRLSFRVPPSINFVLLSRTPDSNFKRFMTMHWRFLMRNNQHVDKQLCRYFILHCVYPPTCFGHLLWPSCFEDPCNIPSKNTFLKMATIDVGSR